MENLPFHSKSFLKNLGSFNARRLSELVQPQGAVIFDADGTLWQDDLGDAFFAFLVERGLIPAREMLKYQAMVLADPETAYGYAVRVMAGLSEAEVVGLSRRFSSTWLPPRLRHDVVDLALALDRSGMRVEVISATADAVIRPAIEYALGKGFDSHGIRVGISDGMLTDNLQRPVSFASGKVTVFNTLKLGPLLVAVGDSIHDIPILKHAKMGIWVGKGEPPKGLVKWMEP